MPSAQTSSAAGLTLVLGTGLLECAASFGVVQTLEGEQIPITGIVASSTGAIYGAALGLGYTTEQLQTFLGKLAPFFELGDSNKLAEIKELTAFRERLSLLDEGGFAELFKQEFGQKTFQELRYPLTVVLTNLSNGEPVEIDQGPLWSVLQASCTIPGLKPPVEINGQLMVDGAVSEPLPLAVAARQTGKLIVSMGFKMRPLEKPQTLSAFAYQLSLLNGNRLIEANMSIATLSQYKDVVALVPDFGAALDLHDVKNLPTIIDKGQQKANDNLPHIKRLLAPDGQTAVPDLQSYVEKSVLVITPSSYLDSTSAPSYQEKIKSLLANGPSQAVMNMQPVEFLSAAGIRMLVAIQQEARRLGGDLRLARLCYEIENVLEIGFDETFDVYGTVPGAITSLLRNTKPGYSKQGKWTDEFLDSMRQVGDELADNAVKALFEQGSLDAVNKLLQDLVSNDYLPPSQLPPIIVQYMSEVSDLPEWMDQTRIDRAQGLFWRYGLQISIVLFCASLPASYAARKGVQVLSMTARLNKQPYRRIMETAQMLIDILTPGGLAPDGMGLRSAQKVRLMHAAIRHMILASGHWNQAEYDYPINQEDLAGTLISFAYVTEGLKMLGINLTEQEEEDYLHIWRVVGHVMGIVPEMLPENVTDGHLLMDAILRRQVAPCEEGREMMSNLLRMMAELIPGTVFDDLPKALVRHMVGNEIADVLGVEKTPWQRAIKPMQWLNATIDELGNNIPVIAKASEAFSQKMLQTLLLHSLGGKRTPFRIPDSLQEAWGISAKQQS